MVVHINFDVSYLILRTLSCKNINNIIVNQIPALNASEMYYVRFQTIKINICLNFVHKRLTHIFFHIIYMEAI